MPDKKVIILTALFFSFLVATSGKIFYVSGQPAPVNNQSTNSSGVISNRTNPGANQSTSSAFDSLKDTFGSLFGK